MTVETETHDAEATPSSVAVPSPAATPAPAPVEPTWHDLGAVEEGRHYESLTGDWFTAKAGEHRQVRFARGVDVSSIKDTASALAAVDAAGRGRVFFKYGAL